MSEEWTVTGQLAQHLGQVTCRCCSQQPAEGSWAVWQRQHDQQLLQHLPLPMATRALRRYFWNVKTGESTYIMPREFIPLVGEGLVMPAHTTPPLKQA